AAEETAVSSSIPNSLRTNIRGRGTGVGAGDRRPQRTGVLGYSESTKLAACKLLSRCGLRSAYWDTTGPYRGVGLAAVSPVIWRRVKAKRGPGPVATQQRARPLVREQRREWR